MPNWKDKAQLHLLSSNLNIILLALFIVKWVDKVVQCTSSHSKYFMLAQNKDLRKQNIEYHYNFIHHDCIVHCQIEIIIRIL